MGDLSGLFYGDANFKPVVVLAQYHVRSVLLRAADGYQDRGATAADTVAQLGPGQLLDVEARARALNKDRKNTSELLRRQRALK